MVATRGQGSADRPPYREADASDEELEDELVDDGGEVRPPPGAGHRCRAPARRLDHFRLLVRGRRWGRSRGAAAGALTR